MILRRSDVLCIRPKRSAPRHAVARLHKLRLRADGFNHASPFLSRNKWQRSAQTAIPELAINGVDAGHGDLHERLVWFELRKRSFDELHHFRSAGLLYANGFHLEGSVYGISSNFPVVFLPSNSSCARCTSASG